MAPSQLHVTEHPRARPHVQPLCWGEAEMGLRLQQEGSLLPAGIIAQKMNGRSPREAICGGST